MTTEDFSFQAKLRLNSSVDYKNVFAKPVKSSDKYFTVLARSNNTNFARIGLAIAKKYVKKANRRNRIKRVIRESFRLKQHNLKSVDIIVLARFDTDSAANEQLRASLNKHWIKLSRQCNRS